MTRVAHVLVVEDHPANLELMRYLLARFNHRVSLASTGEQGLERAREERPDLILCDIQLPGIDGYEFLRRLRGDPHLARVPVVAVTALAMVGDRDKVLAAGFDGYLSKPIDPHNIVAQLQAFIAPSLRARPLEPAADSSPGLAPLSRPGRTILALDNVQINLDLATALFEGFGYRIVTATDPGSALQLAKKSPPDLILSDVCMPGGTGYAFIKAVKADARLSAIPFIFITSTVTNEEDRKKGLALGAAKFLFRPIEPWVLLKEIESCLAVAERA
jgi:two-component system cell cycle response regulator